MCLGAASPAPVLPGTALTGVMVGRTWEMVGMGAALGRGWDLVGVIQ